MGKLFFGQNFIGLDIILVDSRLDKSFVGEQYHKPNYLGKFGQFCTAIDVQN
jgi:hypothetical protein